MSVAQVTFDLPASRAAGEPPERRGLERDGVRLLVARPAGTSDVRFSDLADHLEPGDLLVVNVSATLPAAVAGTRGSRGAVVVHFSTELPDGSWAVEVRPAVDARGSVGDARVGDIVALPAGAALTLLAPYPDEFSSPQSTRLWRTSVSVEGRVADYLARHGRPITYRYLTGEYPLSAYQTVFALKPGSAEMPSAGRPFTAELVTRLVSAGVLLAPVTLHTGVSSLEEGEAPLPEWFDVPATTARLVNFTRTAGRRVVAVGTTVTRALESVAAADGTVSGGRGWTDLVLGPHRPARVVRGIITGWHAPGASHLLLLEAVAGADLVAAAYRSALTDGYLWHEFGDSCLLLPDARSH